MFNKETIAIHKNDFDNNFLGIHTPTFISAFNNLSKEGFGMFAFFSKKINNQRIEFYFYDAKCWLNTTFEAVEKGMNELIEKHYLVKNNSFYDFYQTPLSDEEASFYEAPPRKNILDLGL